MIRTISKAKLLKALKLSDADIGGITVSRTEVGTVIAVNFTGGKHLDSTPVTEESEAKFDMEQFVAARPVGTFPRMSEDGEIVLITKAQLALLEAEVKS